MSGKFQASVQHRGDVSYVKLGGVIDEDNELGDLVDKIPSGTAVIDLGEIERINSCGVRDWVNWLSKLENVGTRSVLVECSPAIVAQTPSQQFRLRLGSLSSVLCPECDEERSSRRGRDMGPPRTARPVALTRGSRHGIRRHAGLLLRVLATSASCRGRQSTARCAISAATARPERGRSRASTNLSTAASESPLAPLDPKRRRTRRGRLQPRPERQGEVAGAEPTPALPVAPHGWRRQSEHAVVEHGSGGCTAKAGTGPPTARSRSRTCRVRLIAKSARASEARYWCSPSTQTRGSARGDRVTYARMRRISSGPRCPAPDAAVVVGHGG